MGGENFNLEDDSKILRINSPQRSVGGPYVVVYKDVEHRWAIAAMEWEGEPRLGIHWFWDKKGHPISTGYAVWFVIPPHLNKAILSGLPLDHGFSNKIDKFLLGDLSGDDLSH